jgi:glycosyltransferase involved in cell wall biosynthesis
MNANDDVTVVITCFNYGAFLTESVESALSQQDGEPRVVVVDDGSTDADTIAVLESLPAQVRVLRQANAGVAAARNGALGRLQTPYALVLDADDRLAPNALGVLRAALANDPRIGFAYGMIRFFGAWEGVLRLPPYDPYRLLYRHNIGPTALMRREMVEDIGGYDPSLTGYEDWELWLHALARGWRGVRVETVTLRHRRHGPSRHLGARPHYRAIFRQVRRKHPELYARPSRRRLVAESDLGWVGRLVYRFWWGWRPLPARVELALQSWLWRPKQAQHDPAV